MSEKKSPVNETGLFFFTNFPNLKISRNEISTIRTSTRSRVFFIIGWNSEPQALQRYPQFKFCQKKRALLTNQGSFLKSNFFYHICQNLNWGYLCGTWLSEFRPILEKYSRTCAGSNDTTFSEKRAKQFFDYFLKCVKWGKCNLFFSEYFQGVVGWCEVFCMCGGMWQNVFRDMFLLICKQ